MRIRPTPPKAGARAVSLAWAITTRSPSSLAFVGGRFAPVGQPVAFVGGHHAALLRGCLETGTHDDEVTARAHHENEQPNAAA